MIKEVEDLINYSATISFREIYFHKDENNNMCTCCSTANLTFMHSIIAIASERKKVVDVIHYLEHTFDWGTSDCEYICECWENRKTLDCVSTTNTILYLLEQALIVCDDHLDVVNVDIIERCSKEDSAYWKSQVLDNPDSAYRQSQVTGFWMTDDYCYHNCVGLINQDDLTLTLIDAPLKKIHTFSNKNLDFEKSIVALKVHKPRNKLDDDKVNYCIWDSKVGLQFGNWYKFKNMDSIHTFNQKELTIFITGLSNNSTNPQAGMGVARAIRKRFENANIVAIHDEDLNESGSLDPSFSSSTSISMDDLKQERFEAIINLIMRNENSYYIPCQDSDVMIFSQGKSLMKKQELPTDILSDININFIANQQVASIASRILCPTYNVLCQLEKPTFPILSKVDFPFKIPPFHLLDSTSSIIDIKQLAEQLGYPLLLKGKFSGAVVCNSFNDIIKSLDGFKDGFIQSYITGTDKGIAFASVKGQMTGGIIMTKTGYTFQGKVLAGDLVSLTSDEKMFQSIEQFCLTTEWDGGAEIEFVEDFSGQKFLIDFNARMPAWIYASIYSNLNLPAELILHSQNFSSYKKVASNECTSLSFFRTTIELPSVNQAPTRHLHYNDNILVPGKNAKGGIKKNVSKFPLLLFGDSESDATLHIEKNLTLLSKTINVSSLISRTTPMRLMSSDVLMSSLLQNQNLFNSALETLSNSIQIQLFISVKTNPHKAVLQAAKKAGYFAECISLAEYYSALNVMNSDEISLTGPCKFWNLGSNAINQSPVPVVRLHSIFADSLEDLDDIFNRLERNEIDCSTIGLRICPAMSLSINISRFGIDCNNPHVVEKALDILRKRLPSSKKLGMHFHFASSTIGLWAWFAQARAFVIFCNEFGKLLGRTIEVIDFGGGFNPFSLFEKIHTSNLSSLFQLIYSQFEKVPSIQFEIGKGISEIAGAIVTRIVSIRDTNERDNSNRAIIVDTSISEISSPHLHPCYLWKDEKWNLLNNGYDVIWGRCCMEFDQICYVELPLEAAVGDYLMFAMCGAYDFSNSYGFGDGVGRDIVVI